VNASSRAQSNRSTNQITTNFHCTRPGEPSNGLSIPVGWVAFYTADMGNTYASKGFGMHSA
jgi:hypothetical protein